MKYNVKENPVDDGFTPIPEGEYELCITKAEVKPAKSGRGENLNLMVQVLEGKYKNRSWFENLCVVHDNDEAQRIARGKLSSLCLAIGIEEFEDESELLDQAFKAVVTVRKGTGGYDDSNQIKRFIIGKGKSKTKVDKSGFVAKYETETAESQEQVTLETDKLPWG